jgi:osmotically-inducible protein OsmY
MHVFRTDCEIGKDVVNALLTDPATDKYEIDVAVQDNAVTLSGTVDPWQEYNSAATTPMSGRRQR